MRYGGVRVEVAGGVPSCRRDAVNKSSAVTLHNTCTRAIWKRTEKHGREKEEKTKRVRGIWNWRLLAFGVRLGFVLGILVDLLLGLEAKANEYGRGLG